MFLIGRKLKSCAIDSLKFPGLKFKVGGSGLKFGVKHCGRMLLRLYAMAGNLSQFQRLIERERMK